MLVDFLSTSKKIEDFISRKVCQTKTKGIVLGLSGGIDSAVVAALSVRAVGADNVLCLIMPSPVNSPHDVEDAKKLADKLGTHKRIIPLKNILAAYSEHLGPDPAATGNLMARIRMSLIYYQANKLNYLVAGTGNKSELMVGYFTKYGDGGCDILPIGDLYKTEVYQLARSLEIPQAIIEKAPSAGLLPGQTDENELGITYEDLDLALEDLTDNLKVKQMVNTSEHKRKPPEVCKL